MAVRGMARPSAWWTGCAMSMCCARFAIRCSTTRTGRSCVPELIAKTALAGRTAVVRGGTTLAEVDLGPVTSIALFPGQAPAVNAGLQSLGLGFPAPNCMASAGGAMIVWTGREQAFLILSLIHI